MLCRTKQNHQLSKHHNNSYFVDVCTYLTADKQRKRLLKFMASKARPAVDSNKHVDGTIYDAFGGAGTLLRRMSYIVLI